MTGKVSIIFESHWHFPEASAFVRPSMKTSSNGNIFRVTGSLCGNSPVTGEFPSQRPVVRSFDASFDLRLHKQSWRRWFGTPLCSLWRHYNATRRLWNSISPYQAKSPEWICNKYSKHDHGKPPTYAVPLTTLIGFRWQHLVLYRTRGSWFKGNLAPVCK